MTKPSLANTVLLVGIGIIWGSQFVLNELAIDSFGALTVAAGRLAIGAVTLAAVLRLVPREGRPRPGGRQPWGLYAAIAVCEGIVPCFLIPWGQERVDSSLAAILMATIPIFTLLLATLAVRDEHWRAASVLCVVIGFAGVLVLMGPEVRRQADSLVGGLAILGGAFTRAVTLILIRRLPPIPPALAMRNVLLLAAVPMVVLSVAFDRPWEHEVSAASVLALAALGALCGGVVYLMLAVLIARAGSTFTSLANYIVVLVGVLIGIAFMGDPFQAHDLVALALILAALGLSQSSGLLTKLPRPF